MKFCVTFADNCDTQKYLTATKKLGTSRFEVLLAKGSSYCEEYAVKIFPKDDQYKTRFQKENDLLASLNHPNIIKYYPITHHTAKFDILIMDYACYGDFCELVMKGGLQHEVHMRTYFHQLVEGLEYLHSKNIAHLDLKLENLLVGKDYLLKIIDFEQSQTHNEERLICGGTSCYRAPEVKERTCTNMTAADIYSLGIILFAFKARQFPFIEVGKEKFVAVDYDTFLEDNQVFWANKVKRLEKQSDFFSEDFKRLLRGMLEKDPSKRMTLEQIKASEWYNKPILSPQSLKSEMERVFHMINSQNEKPKKKKSLVSSFKGLFKHQIKA